MIPLREKIKLAIGTCVLAALAYVVICLAFAADKAHQMGLLK